MESYHLVLVGLFGLVIGSFLNVLIYRLPRKKGLVLERSICPHCSTQLRWYHNVPVLSYLALRGKCAFCHKSISPRYPLVELLNAVGYVYFFLGSGPTLGFMVGAFLTSALLVVFFIDLDFQIIPDVITLPGIALGLLVSFLPNGIGIVQSIIGVLVGGGSLYLIAMLGDWLFKKESMGGGDIKLTAMLGAFLGWQKVVFIFIGSAAIGLVVSVVILAFSKALREHRMIPFGPFLATAAVIAIIYGDRIIEFYISHFLMGR